MRFVASCTLALLVVTLATYSSCAARKRTAAATADQNITATPASPTDDLGGGILARDFEAPARQMSATIRPRAKNLGECLSSTTANKLVDKTGKSLKIDRITDIFTSKIQLEKVTLVPTAGRCRLNGTVTLRDVGGVSTYQIALYITNMATKEILWSNTQQIKISKTGAK